MVINLHNNDKLKRLLLNRSYREVHFEHNKENTEIKYIRTEVIAQSD